MKKATTSELASKVMSIAYTCSVVILQMEQSGLLVEASNPQTTLKPVIGLIVSAAGVFTAIYGAILLVQGLTALAAAYSEGDGPEMSKAIKKLAAAALLIAIGPIIKSQQDKIVKLIPNKLS